MTEEALLETAQRLYGEGEEQFEEWFRILSPEEQKELWVQSFAYTMTILARMIGGG